MSVLFCIFLDQITPKMGATLEEICESIKNENVNRLITLLEKLEDVRVAKEIFKGCHFQSQSPLHLVIENNLEDGLFVLVQSGGKQVLLTTNLVFQILLL